MNAGDLAEKGAEVRAESEPKVVDRMKRSKPRIRIEMEMETKTQLGPGGLSISKRLQKLVISLYLLSIQLPVALE